MKRKKRLLHPEVKLMVREVGWSQMQSVEQLAGEIESMRAELVQKVLEGLRGDAILVAQDLGVSKLMEDDGIDQLFMALKKMIFPLHGAQEDDLSLQALEAKELFRVGQQVAGPLTRQTGESVTSYISDVDAGGAKSRNWTALWSSVMG